MSLISSSFSGAVVGPEGSLQYALKWCLKLDDSDTRKIITSKQGFGSRDAASEGTLQLEESNIFHRPQHALTLHGLHRGHSVGIFMPVKKHSPRGRHTAQGLSACLACVKPSVQFSASPSEVWSKSQFNQTEAKLSKWASIFAHLPWRRDSETNCPSWLPVSHLDTITSDTSQKSPTRI